VLFIGVTPLLGAGALRASASCFLSIGVVAFVREASPFLRESTNLLSIVAQYQILGTFLAALVIVSESLDTFRLSDTLLGALLLSLNVLIVVLSGFWAVSRWRRDNEQRQWRSPLPPEARALVHAVMDAEASRRTSTDSADGRPRVEGQGGGKGHRSTEADVLAQFLLDPATVTLRRRIGIGAFGEVFEGTVDGQPCAVKTMLKVTEANVKAFRAEIMLTATLHHPNIVACFGACWGGDLTGLVLEWVPKGSLGSLLGTPGLALRWEDPLLKLATDVGRGLVYLHGREHFDEASGEMYCIIHR